MVIQVMKIADVINSPEDKMVEATGVESMDLEKDVADHQEMNTETAIGELVAAIGELVAMKVVTAIADIPKISI